MRKREPPRVLGPYRERGKWRLVVVEHGERRSLFIPSEAEALRLKSQLGHEIAGSAVTTVGAALEAFLQHRLESGKVKPKSQLYYRERLTGLLGPVLLLELSALTPRRAASLYQQATQRRVRGRLVAAATHQSQLVLARLLGKWLVRRGLLRDNPFAHVEPVGKARAGKPQLRIDEARAFLACALHRFDTGDRMALAAVIALSMGLRASEIMARRVRDLDDNGRVLWIDEGKSRHATRNPEVPAFLRPYLLRLTEGLPPEAYLFGASRQGGPRERDLVRDATHRICRQAGLPRVCAHSLRGLYATLGIKSGAVPELVAASLGHGSFAVTKRHYAQPSAISDAQTAQVVARLRPEQAAPRPVVPSAQELLRTLSSETLAELLLLAAEQDAKRPSTGRGIDPQTIPVPTSHAATDERAAADLRF